MESRFSQFTTLIESKPMLPNDGNLDGDIAKK